MSTKMIREALDLLAEDPAENYGTLLAARAELESICTAAKDLTRLHLGDGCDSVRQRAHVLQETPDGESTWNHPDVKAWSDAAQLLESIAKDAPSPEVALSTDRE